MKREFLKELGLEKEVIDKILDENGRDIEAEKSKVMEKEKVIDNLNKTLEEANSTIKSYKDMDIEKIKQNASEWESKYNTAMQEKTDIINNSRLEKALKNYDALDNDLILKILDREKLSFEDAKEIKGFDESIKSLKETHPTLFKAETSAESEQGETSGQFKSIEVPEGSNGETNTIQAQLEAIFNSN